MSTVHCDYDGIEESEARRYCAECGGLLMVGRVVQGFEVLRRLGKGGMGSVYLVRQREIGKQAALKVLDRADPTSEAYQRFLREAQVAASLSSPAKVDVFQFGVENISGRPLPWILMEYVDGHDLTSEVLPLESDRVLRIARSVAGLLDEAHGRGICHRDLKPANILVAGAPPDEVVKVADFGVAGAVLAPTISMPMEMLGTLRYMSPEAFSGPSDDPRSDLYSLGVVLYELLTGAPPLSGITQGELLYQILHVDPPPPSTRRTSPEVADWDGLVQQLLCKRPEGRVQSASELLDRLKELPLVDIEIWNADWNLDARLRVERTVTLEMLREPLLQEAKPPAGRYVRGDGFLYRWDLEGHGPLPSETLTVGDLQRIRPDAARLRLNLQGTVRYLGED